MSAPWICPRCERVNAPFIPHCDCIPPSKRVVDEDITNQEKAPDRAYAELKEYRNFGLNRGALTCPRCWQHGFTRTHGLMEMCPYTGQR